MARSFPAWCRERVAGAAERRSSAAWEELNRLKRNVGELTMDLHILREAARLRPTAPGTSDERGARDRRLAENGKSASPQAQIEHPLVRRYRASLGSARVNQDRRRDEPTRALLASGMKLQVRSRLLERGNANRRGRLRFGYRRGARAS